MGEFWVKQELKKLPKDKYIVLNDIMIKQNNCTSQIDHLIISKFGIFVIEMKNYYGLILGKKDQNNWLQYVGKNKRYFQNPIYQNYGHIKAFEQLLNIDYNMFTSIICFSNQADLRKLDVSNVVNLDNLISLITEYKIDKEFNIEQIANKIRQSNITDKFERKNHVKNINKRLEENNRNLNDMICPKCGNKLIIKHGKYGEFIGCTNYPKCKFIKNK